MCGGGGRGGETLHRLYIVLVTMKQLQSVYIIMLEVGDNNSNYFVETYLEWPFHYNYNVSGDDTVAKIVESRTWCLLCHANSRK